ncbi:MAG: ATP-binding protein [Cyanobacteriota bacterium]|nr:ATP-binding protein [Cyanobacteriota bacterium]
MAIGISTILGSFRIPSYLVEAVGLLVLPRRLNHPLWWDELAVLPFWGTDQTSTRAWREGERRGLISLVRLAANPFQRWVLQRALVRQLHSSRDPIGFLYLLLRLQELDVYAIAPLEPSDWKQISSVRQVDLAEIAGRGGDRSRPVERLVFRLTQPLRLPCHTPLTALAGLLHTITQLEDGTARDPDSKPLPLALPASLFEALHNYPGGRELQSSFACINHSLQATSLTELSQLPALLSELTPARSAIRPEVIEALRRLGPISQNIAVARAASSRLNQLAAFARATEAIEELGPFIEQTVVVPEKVLLLRIRDHWRTLVAEAGGRLGEQVQHKRVVNPYVASNPVKGGLFVGRDEILGQLEELWLKTGQVDSLVLYGHRRMGKSSILQNLPHRLDPATNWVVDFNLQTVNRSNTGSLLFDLASKMRDAVLRHPEAQIPATTSAALTVPEEGAFRANYQRAFNQWLDRLSPLLAGRRFIIAIDEYELLEEGMAEGSLDAQLSRYLRGVIQSRDWFVLALAGLYTLQEQCHDYWHPLFASIKPRKVSFLSQAATCRLLTQPSDDFPLDFTSDTLDAIYALTHGQPYLVQLIGQNLIAYYNHQVLDGERQPDMPLSQNDLAAVIASPDFVADGLPYFSGVWAQAQDLPPGQHTILYSLAAAPASLALLSSNLSLPIEQITAALTTLEAHDVIYHDADGVYTFTVELMRRWVAQRLAAAKSSPEVDLPESP